MRAGFYTWKYAPEVILRLLSHENGMGEFQFSKNQISSIPLDLSEVKQINPPSDYQEWNKPFREKEMRERKWKFDDLHLGKISANGMSMETREIEKPKWMELRDWYYFASKICKLVNKDNKF